MKKIGKFLTVTFSLAAILGGAYYVYQNYFKKSEDEEFEEFEDYEHFDDMDDFDDLDSSTDVEKDKTPCKRGYVTLDMGAGKAASDEENDEDADQDNVKVFDLNSDITKD